MLAAIKGMPNPYAHGTEENANPASPPAHGISGKISALLGLALSLPQGKNMPYYFLGGAILAAIALISGGFILISLTQAILYSLIFAMYKTNFKSLMLVNLAFAATALSSAVGLLIGLSSAASTYLFLGCGALLLLIVALWLSMAMQKNHEILFLISVSVAALHFAAAAISGGFAFFPLAVVCVGIPFVIPFVQKHLNRSAEAKPAAVSYTNQTDPLLLFPQQEAQPAQSVSEAEPVQKGVFEEKNTKVFCQNCGSRLTFDSKFCPSCGAKNVKYQEAVQLS